MLRHRYFLDIFKQFIFKDILGNVRSYVMEIGGGREQDVKQRAGPDSNPSHCGKACVDGVLCGQLKHSRELRQVCCGWFHWWKKEREKERG